MRINPKKLETLEKRAERVRKLAKEWGLRDENNMFDSLVKDAIEKAKSIGNSGYYESARNFLRKEIKQIKEYRECKRSYAKK